MPRKCCHFYKEKITRHDSQPLVLAGEKISYVKEAKYLGIWFDQKLTRNPHIQKTINKANRYVFTYRAPQGLDCRCSPLYS